jgi:hypothetical protein
MFLLWGVFEIMTGLSILSESIIFCREDAVAVAVSAITRTAGGNKALNSPSRP